MKPSKNSNIYLIEGKSAVAAWNVDSDEGWTILSGEGANPVADTDNFKFIPTVYRGVSIRGNSVASIPFALVRENGEDFDTSDDWLNRVGFMPNPKQLFSLIEMSLALTGRAYLFKERNRAVIRDLRYLLPTSVTPDINADGATLKITFKRPVNNVERRFTTEDIVYFWLPDPLVEIGPATNYPGKAAANSAGVLKNMDIFSSKFFENGAIKASILAVKGNPTESERERIENIWRSFMTNLRNAFRFKVMNADAVSIVTIGEGLKEIDNPTLGRDKREDVAVALGIPMSILFSNAANYATAEQDDINFVTKTILPECEFIASILNVQVFEKLGLRLEFRHELMDLFREDESAKAQSLSLLVQALSSLDEFMIASSILGYDIDPETMELIEALRAAKEERKEQMAAQMQPKEPEEEQDEEEEEPKLLRATASGNIVPATASLDLERWQRKALNAYHSGKGANVTFTSTTIPLEWYETITERLEGAETEEQIKAAFDVAHYPVPEDGMLALARQLKRANDLMEAKRT